MGLKNDARLKMEMLEKREVPAVIVNQPYDGASLGYVAQDFSDFPSFSSYEFDDFTTTVSYKKIKARAYGTEFGSASANTAVIAEIRTSPDFNVAPVMSSIVGKENATNGDITFSFGKAVLPAGSYWFSAYVVRSFGTGGQWFWHSTQPVTGSESFFHNPGGGFGYGTAPIPGSVIFGAPANMSFLMIGKVGKSSGAEFDFDFKVDSGDAVIQTSQTSESDVRVGITTDSGSEAGAVQDGRIMPKELPGHDLGDDMAIKWGNVL